MPASVEESRAARLVVFTGGEPTASTVETIEGLLTRLDDVHILVVCGAARPRRSRWLRSKFRRLRREPLSYPLELASQVLDRLPLRRRRIVSGGVALPRLGALPGVEAYETDDLHGDACLDRVRAFAPRLGIGIGPPILRASLFRLPELGTINLHKSLLPEYRGMPPGFWELHDGATETGVSIHWMEDTLDSGDVVHQRALPIPPFATPGGLLAELDALGIDVLAEAVADLLSGRSTSRAQPTPTTPTRGRPPFLVRRAVEQRCARRRQPGGGALGVVRECAKRVVLRGYLHGVAPLRNLWRRQRGTAHTTMLLYHRVSDAFADSVTVGIEQFQRQLDLLRRRYDVLDLETWLRERGTPRRRPAVVLTFDDGYADNHLAARLLRRAGLPCTFFVCTRIVGSQRAFPQDQRKLGRTVPALSWEQVHEMATWRFTFGNHTTDHTNVAELPHDEALQRVRSGSADLVEQLGPTGAEHWFAYPYGRPQHMRAELREALPRTGTTFCFSAYGGTNPPNFAPLNVLRQGINFAVSDLAFRAIVEGWRPR